MNCKARLKADSDADKIDTYEAAMLGLTQNVRMNSDRIDALDRRIDVLNDKLDAIIKHLDVPYKSRPITITKPRLHCR